MILTLCAPTAEEATAGAQADAPEELDDEALAEWAAEQELLEGLDPDEVFGLSDLDEPSDMNDKDDDEEIMWRAVDKGKGRAFEAINDDMDMDL